MKRCPHCNGSLAPTKRMAARSPVTAQVRNAAPGQTFQPSDFYEAGADKRVRRAVYGVLWSLVAAGLLKKDGYGVFIRTEAA